MRPWVGVWLCEATDPSLAGGGQGAVLGTRFPALGIPYTDGHLGKAENRIGALGLKGGEGRERGRLMVPTQARVLCPVRGWSLGRPSDRLDAAH